MNPGDLIGLVILIAVLDVSLGALFILIQALFSGYVQRACLNAERMPIRSFIVGLVNFLFFGLITLALFGISNGLEFSRLRVLIFILRPIAVLLGLLLLCFIALGFTVMARLVGQRISAADTSAVRTIIIGTLTLELSTLVPVIGWFLVPLLAGLTGLGAAIIALVWRRLPTADQRPLAEIQNS